MVVPDRGRWGSFLLEQRETRGWTQEEAFAALREGLGLGPKSRSSYVQLERGQRQPDARQQEFLTGYYHAIPVERPQVAPPDLAGAINALVEELREMRLERQELAARVSALEGVVRLLDPPSDATAPEHVAHQESAG